MATRTGRAVPLTICLLLSGQPVLAADPAGTPGASGGPGFSLDGTAGEGRSAAQWRQPSMRGPGGQPWEQPRLDDERAVPDSGERQTPAESLRPRSSPERERPRLQAPPLSVQPRRDGDLDRRQPRQQIGPRRFAPTPDLDGGGSPFDFERDRESRPGRER